MPGIYCRLKQTSIRCKVGGPLRYQHDPDLLVLKAEDSHTPRPLDYLAAMQVSINAFHAHKTVRKHFGVALLNVRFRAVVSATCRSALSRQQLSGQFLPFASDCLAALNSSTNGRLASGHSLQTPQCPKRTFWADKHGSTSVRYPSS